MSPTVIPTESTETAEGEVLAIARPD